MNMLVLSTGCIFKNRSKMAFENDQLIIECRIEWCYTENIYLQFFESISCVFSSFNFFPRKADSFHAQILLTVAVVFVFEGSWTSNWLFQGTKGNLRILTLYKRTKFKTQRITVKRSHDPLSAQLR